MATEIITKQ